MNLMTRSNQTGHQLLSYRSGRTCHKHSHHRLLHRGLPAPRSAWTFSAAVIGRVSAQRLVSDVTGDHVCLLGSPDASGSQVGLEYLLAPICNAEPPPRDQAEVPCPGGGLGAVGRAEFAQHVADVLFDRE